MMLGARGLQGPRGPRAKPCSGVQGAFGPRKLLDLSCFGRPIIHFKTAQKACCKLQITVLKNLFGCQKKRAIIHCDKYTTYFLSVTEDKPKHKANHVDDLKTMEDCDTFSRCT